MKIRTRHKAREGNNAVDPLAVLVINSKPWNRVLPQESHSTICAGLDEYT